MILPTYDLDFSEMHRLFGVSHTVNLYFIPLIHAGLKPRKRDAMSDKESGQTNFESTFE